MKISPWSLKEMNRNLNDLQSLESAQLQKVIYHPKKILFFEFYKSKNLLFFVDLRQPNFFYGLLPGIKAPKKAKKDIPVSLYLHSHFVGKGLRLIELASQYGRILRFHFGEDLVLEIRLYPKDLNIRLINHGKEIFWQKPRELEEMEDNYEPKQYRDLFVASKQWWDEFHGSGVASPSKESAEKQFKKQLGKLEKQEESLLKELDIDRAEQWQVWGDKIMLVQTLPDGLPANLLKQLPEGSYIEQGQFCFEKAKRLRAKKKGKQERLIQVREEIRSLGSNKEMGHSLQQLATDSKDLQKRSGAKTLSKNIADDLRIHIGRSAKENMMLLRKAKPWYMWMHLKDLPGNHLFIERNKNRTLKQAELMKAAEELVKAKKQKLSGEAFPVQYAEVRYVRPIKGDKLGRVRVQKEEVILVPSLS